MKRMHLLALLSLLSFLLVACEGELHGESVKQKQRTRIVRSEVLKFNPDFPFLSEKNIQEMPSYAATCQKASVPYEDCVFLVVLGETISEAEDRTRVVAEVIRKALASSSHPDLVGVSVVILPAVRRQGFEGGITPNSISDVNKFVVGRIILINKGE